jgi:WD40 repeat protein
MGSAPPDTAYTAVWLWDLATATVIRELPGHVNGTTSALFTPDGLTLITGGRDDKIRFWRVSDGVNVRTLNGHTASVRSLAISPDGTMLASGADDASARLWNLSNGTQLARFPVLYPVSDVAFSPAGNLLATAEDGYSTNVRLWDIASGTQVRSFTPEPHGYVSSVAFSPVDGTLVSSSGQAHTIHVWDPDTGALLALYNQETSWGLFPFGQPLAFTHSGRLGYGRGDATVVVATPAGR